jgi:hypothetical protein
MEVLSVDERFGSRLFTAVVVLGVVWAAMAVAMGTPKQAPPTYSMVTPGGDAGVAGGEFAQEFQVTGDDPGASGGVQGAAPATASAGATASAESSTGVFDEGTPAPDQPARVGAPLANIENTPPNTVAMLEPSAATPGSKYDITFAPYGMGLQDANESEFVIKVISSAPQPGVAKAYPFANSNLLAMAGFDVLRNVDKGGLYKGTITLSTRGGLLVPVLSNVTVVTVRK